MFWLSMGPKGKGTGISGAEGSPDLKKSYQTIQVMEVVQNPLPCIVEGRGGLLRTGHERDSSWDFPSRTSGETFTATLFHCSVVPCINLNDKNSGLRF